MIHTILQVATEVTHQPNLITVIITAIATIGAGGLVKLVQLWLNYKKETNKENSSGGLEFRDSLKGRVVELEDKVDLLQSRIEEMIRMYSERILVLSTDNARLQAELDGANKDIDKLLSDLENTEKE